MLLANLLRGGPLAEAVLGGVRTDLAAIGDRGVEPLTLAFILWSGVDVTACAVGVDRSPADEH